MPFYRVKLKNKKDGNENEFYITTPGYNDRMNAAINLLKEKRPTVYANNVVESVRAVPNHITVESTIKE